MASGFYQQDMDALSLTNIEPYTPDPTKNIGLAPFFSALYIVYDPLRVYYRFIDPEVNRVVANWAGDGTGTTMEQITSTTSLPVATFRGNTEIVNFDDFDLFTNIKTITAGSSGSAVGAFENCTNLKKIILPNTITTIGAYAFYGCTSLEFINIPGSVTSIGGYAFYHTSFKKFIHRENCTYGDYVFFGNRTIEYVDIKIQSATFSILYGTGTSNNYCTFVLHGNYTRNGNFNNSGGTYVNVIIDGNLNSSFGVSINLGYLRVKGNVSAVGGSMGIAYPNGPHNFLEFMGQSNNNKLYYSPSVNYTLHLGYNAVINSSYTNFCLGANAKIYIGNGSSRQNDESTLALYLENEGWATQSNKMNTWYDYNGIYKWYYVTDNLTNCTNTNPVDWPFITRKESYETTIVANEGYILSSVQVLMYQCQDNTATPANPTDITSQAYDSSTGKITINEVIGNVEIIGVGLTYSDLIKPVITEVNDTVVITHRLGWSVYYTTDNTVPTTQSTSYNSPITITTPMVVKAIAVNNQETSQVVSYPVRALTATYYTTTDNQTIQLFYYASNVINTDKISVMEVDGVELEQPVYRYAFEHAGNHTVKFIFNQATISNFYISSPWQVSKIIIPTGLTIEQFIGQNNLEEIILNPGSAITNVGGIPKVKEIIVTEGSNIKSYNNNPSYTNYNQNLIIKICSNLVTERYSIVGFPNIEYDDSVTTYGSLINQFGSYNKYMISEGLTSIDDYRFNYITSVRAFIINKSTKLTYSNKFLAANKIGCLYVGRGVSQSDDNTLLSQYQSDSNWSTYTLDTHYNYNTIVGDPIITQTGNVVKFDNRTIECSMYYTTDSTTPTNESTLYTGSITISSDTTFKVIAVKNGMTTSQVVTYSATYSA